MTRTTQIDQEKALYRVVVVNVSTGFAGKHGRRVMTELTLVTGHERLVVQVEDDVYTKSGHAKPQWNVGDTVEAPYIPGKKYMTMKASDIRRMPELTNRAVASIRSSAL